MRIHCSRARVCVCMYVSYVVCCDVVCVVWCYVVSAGIYASLEYGEDKCVVCLRRERAVYGLWLQALTCSLTV